MAYKGGIQGMPTPTYALRLARKTQDDLAQMAKVYGAPNGRAFAREILETVCSGEPARMAAFNRRLLQGVGEQLALTLNAPLEKMVAEDRKVSVRPQKRGPQKRGQSARPRK